MTVRTMMKVKIGYRFSIKNNIIPKSYYEIIYCPH